MKLFPSSVLAVLAFVGGAIACSSSSSSSGASCATVCANIAPVCGTTTCLESCVAVETACGAAQESVFNAWASCGPALVCVDNEYTAATCQSQQAALVLCGGTIGVPDAGHTPGPDATTTGTACAELATCCAKIANATDKTSCTNTVIAGAATTCAATLTSFETLDLCTGVAGTDSGTSGSGTGSSGSGTGSSGSGTGSSGSGSGTSPPGSGSGTGSSGSGTGTGQDAGQPTGCMPHALPNGWTGTDHPTPGTTSCTSTTLATVANDCFTDPDAGAAAACDTDMSTTCGECVYTSSTATDWGPVIEYTTVGTSPGFLVSYPFINLGGCIQGVDPSAGLACAKAFQTVIECELASCVAYCPVVSDTDTAGFDALQGTFDPTTNELTSNGCFENADTTVCATYVSDVSTACASEFNDAGADHGGKCSSDEDWTTIIAAYCGGAVTGL